MQIMDMTALELGRKIKEKEVSVKEAVQASLDTIEAKDKELHSFVTVDAEQCSGACRRSTKRDRGWHLYRAAGRCPGRSEGQYLYGEPADDLQFKDPL